MTSTFVNITLVPGTGMSGSLIVCFMGLLLNFMFHVGFTAKSETDHVPSLVLDAAAATNKKQDCKEANHVLMHV